MKIIDVTLQNFRSFEGVHTIPVHGRGLVSVQGVNHDEPRMNSNGSGKSSFVEAIDWCAFGVEPRGDTAASVVNRNVGKDCLVTLNLENDDGTPAIIRRGRGIKGKNILEFIVDTDDDRTTLDPKETQKLIDTFLGMDREIFHSTVFFGQEDKFEFADATDKQRKEILTRVLQLEHIDEWASNLSGILKDLDKRITDDGNEYNRLYAQWEAESKRNPRENFDRWEQQRADHVASLCARSADHVIEGANIQNELNALPTLEAIPPEPQPPAELAQAQEAVKTLTENDNAVRAKITASQGGTCPTCGQEVPAGLDLESLISAMADNDIRLQTARRWEEKVREDFNAARREHASRCAEVNAARGHRESLEASLSRLASSSERVSAEITQRQNEPNPYLSEIEQHAVNLENLANTLAGMRASLEELIDDQTHYAFWKDGFGNKGLKSFVLDSRLAEMTEEANRWVQLLTGNTHWIRFESQRKVGTGSKEKLTDDFSIRVFRYESDGSILEQNYRSYSGGEKSRIGLGVDFGLASLVAKRASKKWDLLILDEKFRQSLDQSGKDAIAELLQAMAEEKSSVFVVDHDVMFQGLFEDVLVVEKRHGKSKVRGGA